MGDCMFLGMVIGMVSTSMCAAEAMQRKWQKFGTWWEPEKWGSLTPHYHFLAYVYLTDSISIN